jgi:hypothetical protein
VQGLTIVGVTSEGKSSTEKWVEQQGAEYAYAYDSGGSLSRYFGVGGIPNAVLVDPSGTVVWQGHPGNLTGSIIEKALDGALEKPMWEWPAETKKLKGYLKKESYAKALAEAGKLEGPYKGLVEAQIAGKLVAVEKAREAGDFLGAETKGEQGKKHLKGLPEADQIEMILKEIAKDPEAKRVMKGQKKLAAVMADVAEIQSKGKAKKLKAALKELCDDYPDTIVDAEAKDAIGMLRKRFKV